LATPGVSQYNINAAALRTRFFIPLLPLAQQAKLAAFEALFDDERRTLDATIAAKQKFRRGIMQPLMTGKIRFPQFSQTSWRSATVGSLFEVVSRPIDWDESASYDLLSIRRRSGGVFVRGRLPAEKIATKTLFEVRAGDVLISKMQAVHGAIGLAKSEHDGMKVSGSYVALRPKPNARMTPEFFAWLTRLPQMYKAVLFSSHGVHIEKMTFSVNWYLRTRVLLPEHQDEQSRIVALLNSLEYEENLLVALSTALEGQKHALLDKLLSGELSLSPI
jgi:type I restriction enzyme S subunit